MMRSILPVSARMGIVFAAFALCASVRPTVAIQPTLEKITQEADGTVTYHYKIRIDETIHVEGQGEEPNPDFFTIFNFTGMVPGSEKQPAGWTFSTSTNGVTPYRGGRRVLATQPYMEPQRSNGARSHRDFRILSPHHRQGHHCRRIRVTGHTQQFRYAHHC